MPANAVRTALVTLLLLVAGGCTPNVMYRDSFVPCRMQPGDGTCERSSLQEIQPPGGEDARYVLAFVEFDDQGLQFDPEQQRRLFAQLVAESRSRDAVIVTFVHGWHHNAKDSDDNVRDFRLLLGELAAEELKRPVGKRRRVFGIYVGWRGESGDVPGVNLLTFWSRKDGARRVAEGSVRGLLGQVKAFRDALVARGAHTKMITIGHSFGAQVVYDAVAQYLMDQAGKSRVEAVYFRDREKEPPLIRSYGDLVLLVNPAIEAMRYQPLRLLLDQVYWQDPPGPRYAPRQPPVFVQVTSVGTTAFEGDWATGVAFPVGRSFSSALERKRYDPASQESETDLTLTAMGHHKPFWTHELEKVGEPRVPMQVRRRHGRAMDQEAIDDCRAFLRFRNSAESAPGYLKPGWSRVYDSGAQLRDLANPRFNPNNPFWMVRARPNIILDHNDIEEPAFVEFVVQLSADIDRLLDPDLCPSILRSGGANLRSAAASR